MVLAFRRGSAQLAVSSTASANGREETRKKKPAEAGQRPAWRAGGGEIHQADAVLTDKPRAGSGRDRQANLELRTDAIRPALAKAPESDKVPRVRCR